MPDLIFHGMKEPPKQMMTILIVIRYSLAQKNRAGFSAVFFSAQTHKVSQKLSQYCRLQ